MTTSDHDDRRFERHGGLLFERPSPGVLLVTINRPDRGNACDAELHHSLSYVWRDIDEDPSVSVVVITGAGRTFSAGGDNDLVGSQLGNYAGMRDAMRGASDLVYNMIHSKKVIISAINGAAVGTGLAVALLADISIMSADARIADGHMRLGVAAGDHSAAIWPLLCGVAKAKYYLLTSEFIDGPTAERIGLVSKCLPASEVLGDALRIASQLAEGPQDAALWTKRSINLWLQQGLPSFEASLAFEMLGFFGADAPEGLQAIVERRAPRYPSGFGPATGAAAAADGRVGALDGR